MLQACMTLMIIVMHTAGATEYYAALKKHSHHAMLNSLSLGIYMLHAE